MGIKEEIIELQCLDQGTKAISEQVDLIAFPQDTGNFSRLNAGGNEVEHASRCYGRAKLGRGIVRYLLHATTAIEGIVEGQASRLPIHPKEDMQPWWLEGGVVHSRSFA